MSDADVQARLRAYRDAAQRREVSPNAWPRLERRLRREPCRRAALAAAAVALVVGVAAVGAGPVARWAERQPATAGAPGRPTVAARIPLGCPLGNLEVGFGAVWVACDAVLIRIDPAANRIAAVIPLEGGVADIAFSDDWVWAASGSSTHPVVYQIDPVRNRQVSSMPVLEDPSGIVIAEGVAWVISDGAEPGTQGPARVARLDAATVARLPSVQLPSPPVRIHSGFGAIWVSTYHPDQGAVYRIDPRTLATIRVPRAQSVVAVGPDSLWVTFDNPATGIHRIDPVSGRVLATIPVPTRGIRAVVLGQGALWVSTDAELYRLDPDDAREVGAPVPLEAPSVAIALGEGGIWVGERGRETFITRFNLPP
jgi:hypothetical protein